MMLRASIDDGSNRPAEVLEALVDAVAPRVPNGDGDGDAARDRADRARRAVVDQLGPAWLVDACAVIANFEMMTRIADGTGARLPPDRLEASAAVIAADRLDRLPSARH